VENCEAIRCAKLQWNRHHQQTKTRGLFADKAMQTDGAVTYYYICVQRQWVVKSMTDMRQNTYISSERQAAVEWRMTSVCLLLWQTRRCSMFDWTRVRRFHVSRPLARRLFSIITTLSLHHHSQQQQQQQPITSSTATVPRDMRRAVMHRRF